ncbi:MAG: LacI family DNA-binding transcriptional regulator [Victivallales bacterium]|nr:LacI family DNA-binding transcriptional regulator [Victivallales bacterium]
MITMKDIARLAGVSQTTVSLVLNRRQTSLRIGDDTRRRVLDIASKAGYYPNAIARAMVNGRTGVIGYSGSAQTEHIGRMLDGVLSGAQATDYFIKVLQPGGSVTQQMLLRKVIEQRLSGIIWVDSDEAFLDLAQAELSKVRIPMVILDHTQINTGDKLAAGIRIRSDDEAGIGLAVEHLAELGHSRIGFVSTHGAGSTTYLCRAEGFRRAMVKLGLKIPGSYQRWPAESGIEGSLKLIAEMLSGQERPTAIVCETDYIAMTALRAARHLGLRVPEDISVVGFANLTMGEYADPPLTTVSQSFRLMGETAVKWLVSAIDNIDDQNQERSSLKLVPTHLIIRGSTGPVP